MNGMNTSILAPETRTPRTVFNVTMQNGKSVAAPRSKLKKTTFRALQEKILDQQCTINEQSDALVKSEHLRGLDFNLAVSQQQKLRECGKGRAEDQAKIRSLEKAIADKDRFINELREAHKTETANLRSWYTQSKAAIKKAVMIANGWGFRRARQGINSLMHLPLG